MVLMMTCGNAFASYYTSSSRNFGSNALWLPNRNAAYAQRVREVRRYNAVTKAIENQNNYNFNHNINSNSNKTSASNSANDLATAVLVTNTANQISRLDRNYKISTPKVYTKNGITYYD